MVKLKRLKIEKFRNVAPGTELRFRDSMNVLLGKNGTGKTTLLNLIVSLLRWDFSSLLNEPFALEYELLTPRNSTTVRLRNEPRPAFSGLSHDSQLSTQELLAGALLPAGDDYESAGEIVLASSNLEAEYTIKFSGSKLSLRGKKLHLGSIDLARPIAAGEAWINIAAALFQIKQQNKLDAPLISIFLDSATSMSPPSLQRFDESLDYLYSTTGDERAFLAARAFSQDAQDSFDVAPRNGGPRAVHQEIQRQLQKTSDVDEVRVQSSDAGAEFLGKAVQLLGFESAKLRIQRTARQTEPSERIYFGNIRFDFTRRDRSVINHLLLSYGQKRLLAFYYYLACNPATVVADELVNGMHHEWIEACMEELGGRQSFLTSQNPLLLDYLGFESADEVLSSFVLCRAEPQGERDQLRWENMTPEDAQGFFAAYQVGIQHVSEILRTRGLW
ncbi:AAA family ATPase [Pyxidicoccus xibeiensis]|uniref:AAA family ATPase n=1 Tax=Pyxidicoccus xibeiensis TaxID=2906759 RepID=UPI0020A798B0|nr:AAA family ATPase [Pyxidicoccus xibeiensis]MCP3135914.1 AAA family ATPase [Pyxidicoccus xibeiensis]